MRWTLRRKSISWRGRSRVAATWSGGSRWRCTRRACERLVMFSARAPRVARAVVRGREDAQRATQPTRGAREPSRNRWSVSGRLSCAVRSYRMKCSPASSTSSSKSMVGGGASFPGVSFPVSGLIATVWSSLGRLSGRRDRTATSLGLKAIHRESTTDAPVSGRGSGARSSPGAYATSLPSSAPIDRARAERDCPRIFDIGIAGLSGLLPGHLNVSTLSAEYF